MDLNQNLHNYFLRYGPERITFPRSDVQRSRSQKRFLAEAYQRRLVVDFFLVDQNDAHSMGCTYSTRYVSELRPPRTLCHTRRMSVCLFTSLLVVVGRRQPPDPDPGGF